MRLFICLLIVITSLGCTNDGIEESLTRDDVRVLLENENYQKMYQLISSSDNSIKSSKDENALYKELTKSLLYSETEYADSLIKLGNSESALDTLLARQILENENKIPQGSEALVLDYFLKRGDKFKPRLRQAYINDTTFSSNVDSLLYELAMDNSHSKVLPLLEITDIQVPDSYRNIITKSLQEKEQALKKKEELSSEKKNLERNVSLLRSEIEDLKEEYKISIALVEKSYSFRGYMISKLGGSSTNEFYEVQDGYRNTHVLITTETSFKSRGYFSLRVVESGNQPMELKNGFTKDVPVLTELTDRARANYNEYQRKIEEVENELYQHQRRLERLDEQMRTKKELESFVETKDYLIESAMKKIADSINKTRN